MTMITTTSHIHALRLVAALAAVPLLCGCPGKTGEDGDGSATSAGSSSGSDSSSGDSGSGGATSASGSTGISEGSSGGGECTEEECGPAPGAPNFLCQDGVTVGGPGPCERNAEGVCGWTFVPCPQCCYAAEQPPCFEGASCCADGSWACNDDAGQPTCETAPVCACCQPGEEPECIEGVSCCGGGEWQCNDDGGQPTCEDLGVVCDLPPPPSCCEPAEEPECIEGAICCADGSWACNELGMPPCDTGDICGDGMCQLEGETCASGEGCCAGLDCCQGVPVPPGAEYCSAMCPISDRERKLGFAAVDPDEILAKLVDVPITTWSYDFEDPSIRHLGPMAQDFKHAFEVGATDEKIFQIDADGVALVSIQALHGEVARLRSRNAALEETLASLQARLERLEAR